MEQRPVRNSRPSASNSAQSWAIRAPSSDLTGFLRTAVRLRGNDGAGDDDASRFTASCLPEHQWAIYRLQFSSCVQDGESKRVQTQFDYSCEQCWSGSLRNLLLSIVFVSLPAGIGAAIVALVYGLEREPNWVSAAANIVIAIATCIGICLLWKTLRATNATLREAQRTTREAKKQNRIAEARARARLTIGDVEVCKNADCRTREQLVPFEDARVEVCADQYSVPTGGKSAIEMVDKELGSGGRVFQLTVANSGGVPAINVNVSLDEELGECFPVRSIAAGSSESACLRVPSDWFPINIAEPKDTNSAVCIEYDAGFGRRYRGRQRFKFHFELAGDASDWRVTLDGAAEPDIEVKESTEVAT